MRSALITFFACFLGMLAALLVYHQYRKYDAARVEAAKDAELQARIEQGRKLAEQTLAQQFATQAMRNDIVAASMARVSVSEFYMSNGRMPANNAEAGLAEADSFRGQSLISLTVTDQGQVKLVFDALSGVDGGTVEWHPDLAGIESMGLQWECLSHDYPQISTILHGCAFEPDHAAPVQVAR